MLMLLLDNHFSVGGAVAELADRNNNIDDLVDRVAELRIRRPNQMQQDERLAMFITVTSINSPSAAARVLRRVGWDFARAIDVWVRLGYLPKKTSSRPGGTSRRSIVSGTTRAINADRPFTLSAPGGNDPSSPSGDSDHESSSLSSSDDESVVALSGYESTSSLDLDIVPTTRADLMMPVDTYGIGDKNRKGYVIDQDRHPAKPFCPDPTKLHIEWIKNGKYKVKWFPGAIKKKTFRWNDSDHESDIEKLEFDWNDTEHIGKLNRWREEEFRRITSETTKAPGVKYEADELEFIWDKHAMWTEEKFWEMAGRRSLAEAKAFFAEKNNFPLHVPRRVVDIWTNEFNVQFAGRRAIQNPRAHPPGVPRSPPRVFRDPRPARVVGSIDIQRRRIIAVPTASLPNVGLGNVTLSTVEDFNVEWQPAH